jgi:hypothetical protein
VWVGVVRGGVAVFFAVEAGGAVGWGKCVHFHGVWFKIDIPAIGCFNAHCKIIPGFGGNDKARFYSYKIGHRKS